MVLFAGRVLLYCLLLPQTDELLLTTCCIRYQHVMKDVMAAHIELFGKTIHERVREETSGNYEKTLLAVLNAAWPEYGN